LPQWPENFHAEKRKQAEVENLGKSFTGEQKSLPVLLKERLLYREGQKWGNIQQLRRWSRLGGLYKEEEQERR
jgi:hypothetical protein